MQSCDFATPAKEGLVDLLIGVDNADLLYSRADVCGEPGSPIARLGPLGWSCIGAQRKSEELTVERTLLEHFCPGVLQKLLPVARNRFKVDLHG